MRWRDRGLALLVVATFTALAHRAWADPVEYAEGVYLWITTLGYGHLLGAAVFARRRARTLRPARVGRVLWASFLGVSLASLLAAYGMALEAEPMLVLVMFAISTWHIVENDLALGSPKIGGAAVPRLWGSPRRHLAALLGTGAIVVLGAGTPEIAALWPGRALGVPGPPLAELFSVVTGYHLITWIIYAWSRTSARARAGDATGARRARLRLLAVHAAPLLVCCVVLALGPAGKPARALVFGPGLYLFWSVLHVLQTALARSRAEISQEPLFDPHPARLACRTAHAETSP